MRSMKSWSLRNTVWGDEESRAGRTLFYRLLTWPLITSSSPSLLVQEQPSCYHLPPLDRQGRLHLPWKEPLAFLYNSREAISSLFTSFSSDCQLLSLLHFSWAPAPPDATVSDHWGLCLVGRALGVKSGLGKSLPPSALQCPPLCNEGLELGNRLFGDSYDLPITCVGWKN